MKTIKTYFMGREVNFEMTNLTLMKSPDQDDWGGSSQNFENAKV